MNRRWIQTTLQNIYPGLVFSGLVLSMGLTPFQREIRRALQHSIWGQPLTVYAQMKVFLHPKATTNQQNTGGSSDKPNHPSPV